MSLDVEIPAAVAVGRPGGERAVAGLAVNTQ